MPNKSFKERRTIAPRLRRGLNANVWPLQTNVHRLKVFIIVQGRFAPKAENIQSVMSVYIVECAECEGASAESGSLT